MHPHSAVHATCLALSGLSLAGALYSFRKGRTRDALFFVIAAGLCLRLLPWADRFLHPWDERVHALVARNLLRHPFRPTLYDDPALPYDFRDWQGNHIWLHKPPFALWLMAGSMALFGANEQALRLPSLILSTVSIFLTYRICRRLLDEKSALIAATLQAVNGFLIVLAAGRTATDHVDTVFFFLVSAGAALAVIYRDRRSWGCLAGVGLLAGLAILTKWMAGLLIIALWVCLAWGGERRRRVLVKLLAALGIALLLAFPWYWHTRSAFPSESAWEGMYNLRHLFEPLEGHAAGPFYFLERLPRFFGELVYLPIVWFLVRTLREPRNAGVRMLALWFGGPLVVYSLSATKMPGYIMVSAPAVFGMVGTCAVRLWDAIGSRRGRWVARALALGLILTPARVCLERIKPFRIDHVEVGAAREMRRLRPLIGDAVVFNARRPIELMFYSGATAYPGLPDSTIVRDLRSLGRRVVVLDDGSLPSWIGSDPRIERVEARGSP